MPVQVQEGLRMIALFLITFLIGYILADVVIRYNESQRQAVEIDRQRAVHSE